MTDLAGPRPPIGGTAFVAVPGVASDYEPSIVRNARLQYLRGFAALAVLFYHCATYLELLRGSEAMNGVFPGGWGAYGVAVFFALSGYLMSDLLRRDDPGTFLVSRIARIYPTMFIIIALASVLFVLIGQPRGFNFWALTLVPSGPRPYFLGVEWTLLYEMTYYVGLTVLAFLGLARFAPVAMLAWLVILAGAFALGPGQAHPGAPTLSEFPLTVLNIPFVLGFLAGELHRRGALPRSLMPAAIILLLPVFVFELDAAMLRLVTGLSASLLVASAVTAPMTVPSGPLARFGLRLGDASYVLYLVHVPIIMTLSAVLPAATPPVLLWFVWAGASTAAAIALAPLDGAIHRRLKRHITGAPKRRLSIVALAFIGFFLAVAAAGEFRMRGEAADTARATRILSGPTSVAGPSVRMAIDAIATMPTGNLVVRGYGIDLDKPQLGSHVALRQAGQTLALVDLDRMRAATADALGRTDLRKVRFGFRLMLPKEFTCEGGALEPFLLLEDGRSLPIPLGALAAVCGK